MRTGDFLAQAEAELRADVDDRMAVAAVKLEAGRATFRRWLGEDYDLAALDTVLAAAAVEQLDGDPVWLLLISGAGNAKTETVTALKGVGAHVVSAISSPGALLSATSRKERTDDASGGLLRQVGERGIIVLKDFTTLISQGSEVRSENLAALREIYDGQWVRNVGTDGGRSLEWTGRLVLIGAVTTAYDSAHGVIASMGDRFALCRIDSNLGRTASGRQALLNVGSEKTMRAELAEAVGAVLAEVDESLAVLDEPLMSELLRAADTVTMVRTAVEHDPRSREPLWAHAPEMPTRFAKMLAQIVRGGLAIGMTREHALTTAIRVARDSCPPSRLEVLADVIAHPGSKTAEVVGRLQKPSTSLDRTLNELQLLGLTVRSQTPTERGWRHYPSSTLDQLSPVFLHSRNISSPPTPVGEAPSEALSLSPSTDIAGATCARCGAPATCSVVGVSACQSCAWISTFTITEESS